MRSSSPGWLAVAATLLLMPGTIGAQTLYRCGNQYQDRPCEAGKPAKRIAGGATRSAATPAVPLDGECSRRGERALKVVWAREAGATEAQQLAQAPASATEGSEQRRLVQAVYARRGSAPDIRAAIEADCMAEKEKVRQAQAMSAAAAKLMQDLPAEERTAAGQPANVTAQRVTAAQAAAEEASGAARAAEDARLRECSRTRNELSAVRDQQRRGGSAATMESLTDQRRALERSLTSNGC
jgi:hypothetical protein